MDENRRELHRLNRSERGFELCVPRAGRLTQISA